MADESVEIWFPVPPDAQGYPSSQPWEQLYAEPVAGSHYRVGNIPFFARGVAFGDIVSARLTDAGWLEFADVVERGGHSTMRVWLADHLAAGAAEVARQFESRGCRVECTLQRLLAIDVPDGVEETVWQYLQDGKARGDWDVQVGYSPD